MLSTEDAFKKLFLKHPEIYRKAVLTDSQLKLLDDIGSGGVYSHTVAKYYGCSVQSASARLKELLLRGYLNRVETVSLSGGIEFLYTRRF